MSRRRFFADAVDGTGGARILGPGALHLARVLRAQPGQEYELAHAGRVYLGRIRQVAAQAVEFDLVEELPTPPPAPTLELGVVVFKFDRFEWMLEKATELGVTALWPLASRRSDAKLLAAAEKRQIRWRQIAHQAAEQSRRADCPDIAAPQPLTAFLALPFAGARRLLLEAAPETAALAGTSAPCRLLVGPEGGFAPEEATSAASAGFTPASLGPRILRCETAVLAALVLLGTAQSAPCLR